MSKEYTWEGPEKRPKWYSRVQVWVVAIAALLAGILGAMTGYMWGGGASGAALAAPLSLVFLAMAITAVALTLVGARGLKIFKSEFSLRDTTTVDRILAFFVLFVLACLAVPNFLEATVRAKVSRVHTDMRSFSLLLRTYFNDQGFYPAVSTGTTSVNGAYFAHPDLQRLPSFRVDPGVRDPFIVPIRDAGWEPYYYPADPFAPKTETDLAERRAAFVYFPAGEGNEVAWIVVSAGPDGDYDIDPREVYDSSAKRPSAVLLTLTYDATNGTLSDGDLWRTKAFAIPR